MSFNYEYKIKYTNNPYIDLLVHQTKNMVMNSVVKNERTALKYETESSRTSSDNYIRYKLGKLTELPDYDPDEYEEQNNYYRMLEGLPPIPMDSDLQAFYEKYGSTADVNILYEAAYIPLNPYLEMITRLPKGDASDADINILKDKYLHEFNKNQEVITLLDANGVMEQIEQDYSGPSYSYMYHLGDKSIDPYTARTSPNFTLLYLPYSETEYFDEIYYKFKRVYDRNRDFTISTIYSEAYAFGSINYDDFIQIFILIQTMIDMISEVQEYIINKDVFDSRTIRYLFESYGIDYYKEIPVTYQMRIIKNVNLLLKYKSSNKNIFDILNLFDNPGINIYTYYLMKTKKSNESEFAFYTEKDINVHYITSNDIIYYIVDDFEIKNNRVEICRDYEGKKINIGWIDIGVARNSKYCIDRNIKSGMIVELHNTPVYKEYNTGYLIDESKIGTEKFNENYELSFLRIPIDDQNISNYIEDKTNRRSYDSITLQDPFWDGVSKMDILTDQERENYHNAKKQEVLDEDFSCIRTKYLSIDADIDVCEMSFQMSYFLNMLFDKHLDEENVKIQVDSKISKNKVKLADLICLAIALGYLYNGLEPNVLTTSMEENMIINGFDFDSSWTFIYNELGMKSQGYLVELDSDNPGAFLSGRYNESVIWNNLKHTKIYDEYQAYDNYTYADENKYAKNYPTYLEPAIESKSYSLSNIDKDINGQYHIVDLTWQTPYDPDNNSHADFVDTKNLIDLNDNSYTDLDRMYKLKQIYYTNKRLYKHLTYMMRTADSKDIYDIYNTLYESFMETKFSTVFYRLKDYSTGEARTIYVDKDNNMFLFEDGVFKSTTTDKTYPFKMTIDGEVIPDTDELEAVVASNYYEFLRNRNIDLYNVLKTAANKTEDEQKSYISMICEHIALALNKYFKTNEWKYLYNIIPTKDIESFEKYIMKVIIFFKSWKTQMLDQNIIYNIDDPYANQIRILDGVNLNLNQNLYEKPGPRDFIDWILDVPINDKISPIEKVFIKPYVVGG